MEILKEGNVNNNKTQQRCACAIGKSLEWLSLLDGYSNPLLKI
jgi:hypothetical protein